MTTDAQPTVRYETRDRKAYLTLDRPDRLNAIDSRMPGELAAAVQRANVDPGVHVIVLQGAGRAFCSGYDLKLSAEDGRGAQPDAVWDPIRDYATMKQFTDDFFTLGGDSLAGPRGVGRSYPTSGRECGHRLWA